MAKRVVVIPLVVAVLFSATLATLVLSPVTVDAHKVRRCDYSHECLELPIPGSYPLAYDRFCKIIANCECVEHTHGEGPDGEMDNG